MATNAGQQGTAPPPPEGGGLPQTLALSADGKTLSISDGNTVVFPSSGVIDVAAIAAEMNTLDLDPELDTDVFGAEIGQ